LNFSSGTAGCGADWAHLSILRAASLVLGVIATIGFSAEVLSSTAKLGVVAAELSLRTVAACTAKIPTHWAEVFFLVANFELTAVAGSVTDGVVGHSADVIVDASEAGTVHTSSFAAEIDSLSRAVFVGHAALS